MEMGDVNEDEQGRRKMEFSMELEDGEIPSDENEQAGPGIDQAGLDKAGVNNREVPGPYFTIQSEKEITLNDDLFSISTSPTPGIRHVKLTDPPQYSELHDWDYTELERTAEVLASRPSAQPKSAEYNDGHIDSSSDCSISTDDSSNDSEGPLWKRKIASESDNSSGTKKEMATKEFINPNATKQPQNQESTDNTNILPESDFQNKATAFQKRRVNNIWGDVLKQEQIELTGESLGRFSLKGAKSIRRGPESFVIDEDQVTRPMKRAHSSSSKDPSVKNWESYYDSDVSVSSGGLSEDSKTFIKINKDARSESENGDKKKGGNLKRKHRKKLSLKLKNLSDEKLVTFICENLQERKAELIEHVVRRLGREAAIRVFFKTIKIERTGGLLIKDGSRRRTAGGVYLYLLRNDTRLDSKIVNEILETQLPPSSTPRLRTWIWKVNP